MFGQPTELVDSVSFDVIQVVLNLLAATGLSLLAALVYRRTHHGLSYSQGFVVSMVFVSVIACGAIMVIGSSIARAFGLVGALSIIRYRTVVKDTRDASFIFLALVAGFAAGTGNFLIGALTVATVLALALVIHRFRFGVLKEHDFILTFSLPRESAAPATPPPYLAILGRLCERHTLLHAETTEDATIMLLTFDISLKEGVDSPALVQALAGTPPIGSPKLIFAKGDPNF
jgi:hypothetical protein